jgi:hypothetical protein
MLHAVKTRYKIISIPASLKSGYTIPALVPALKKSGYGYRFCKNEHNYLVTTEPPKFISAARAR